MLSSFESVRACFYLFKTGRFNRFSLAESAYDDDFRVDQDQMSPIQRRVE